MFAGIYTPSITPLREDGSIDLENWEKHVDNLIAAGINGVLLFGSIGEFYAFTVEEKQEAIRHMTKHVAGRTQLLVGTGGTNQEEVIALTNYADECGADAVVIVSPYYFGPSEEVAEKYFSAIAENTKLPILLYNFPDRTGSDLTPELVARLAGKYESIVGIKDTVDNASHTRKIVQAVHPIRKDFSVLSGYDEYYLSNRVSGGAGILTGMTNVEPETFVAMHRAYERGDYAIAIQQATRVANLMRIYDVSDLFITAIKAAVKVKGLPINTVAKEPALQANAQTEAAVRNILES
ncbi:dihydrodipicolinate synthetase [Actinobaculum suis]|uniref:4-hydroxy-tetrahydrodipicolinate synthase n=1 Tax=Actinobaculum suis TaxID=1657 RepID=A0A1B9BCA3_9ACTO|nr:4-hydroxy-tetrahydrodipicolinate synthase [Actinobaculum suis]OCA93281.1 4-hydroxy-tetrahydrodipicolinate synthase [Actinobaculum suis]OCA94435.1 4-hydroxy-tetrahydrodipicolinate synthase [Actinobaculum suis]VDG76705.1 dihydrodipicolinate synthetase [Actinobaculum suis]